MSDVPFQDATRIDARDKVRGKALFGADDARPDMVHAALARWPPSEKVAS